jgi:hypothetical protein
MAEFIELTSQTSRDMRWLVSVEAIAFVRRKGPEDSASILLKTGGTLEPAESYTYIHDMLQAPTS